MIEANNDEVICQNCVTQFRAIPVNVQDQIRQLEATNKELLEAVISLLGYESQNISLEEIIAIEDKARMAIDRATGEKV